MPNESDPVELPRNGRLRVTARMLAGPDVLSPRLRPIARTRPVPLGSARRMAGDPIGLGQWCALAGIVTLILAIAGAR